MVRYLYDYTDNETARKLCELGYVGRLLEELNPLEWDELYAKHLEGLSHPATFPLGTCELPDGCPKNILKVSKRIDAALTLAAKYEWCGRGEWAEVALKEALCLEGLLPELRAELA